MQGNADLLQGGGRLGTIKCQTIAGILDELAPRSLAESWDNVGLLTGDGRKTVNRVMVCLDAPEWVIEEAIENKVDMIISHHPMIFSGIKRVNTDTAIGRKLIRLIKNDISADFGIAAEPEYNKSIIGSVGKMLIRVDIRGIAAHGCEPDKGINAIEEGSRFLAALDQIPLLSHPNISSQPYVTLKIEGGFKEYSIVVPEHCSFIVNKHTVPSETKEYVLNEMEKLVKQLGLKAKFTFSVEEPYYPAYDIGMDISYLKKISAIYEEIVRKPLQFGYGTGVSDTNLLVPLTNIPTISLGPCGGGLHSSNEWVSIESVHEMDRIYRTFIFGN